jgi:hypothetical protein
MLRITRTFVTLQQSYPTRLGSSRDHHSITSIRSILDENFQVLDAARITGRRVRKIWGNSKISGTPDLCASRITGALIRPDCGHAQSICGVHAQIIPKTPNMKQCLHDRSADIKVHLDASCRHFDRYIRDDQQLQAYQ